MVRKYTIEKEIKILKIGISFGETNDTKEKGKFYLVIIYHEGKPLCDV